MIREINMVVHWPTYPGFPNIDVLHLLPILIFIKYMYYMLDISNICKPKLKLIRNLSLRSNAALLHNSVAILQ